MNNLLISLDAEISQYSHIVAKTMPPALVISVYVFCKEAFLEK